MTIVRVGTTKKYSEAWDSVFTKGKKKATATAAAKPTKKAKKKSVKKAAPAKVALKKAPSKKKPAKKK